MFRHSHRIALGAALLGLLVCWSRSGHAETSPYNCEISEAVQVTTPSPSQQDRVFQGTLIEIDTNAKVITAKAGDNSEMMFRYTDNTEIVGSEASAQALARQAGSDLTITYNVSEGSNIATRVEFVPSADSSSQNYSR